MFRMIVCVSVIMAASVACGGNEGGERTTPAAPAATATATSEVTATLDAEPAPTDSPAASPSATTAATADATTPAAATPTATVPPTNTPAPTATPTPWPVSEVTITGRPSTWSLDAVTVGVGSKVTWTWSDNIHVHNVTVPGYLSDVPVTKQGARSVTFQQAGNFTFTCDAHPDTMVGTVMVR